MSEESMHECIFCEDTYDENDLTLPQIEFDILDHDSLPCFHRFWRPLAPWLKEKGYVIHDPLKARRSRTTSPMPCSFDVKHPYSFFDNEECEPGIEPRTTRTVSSKVVCAQDRETREVYIKLVKRFSDEFKIYELLKNTPSAYDEENFCCVLPPVDFLKYGDDYVFVVVPRWGINPLDPLFSNNQEAIDAMMQLLTGLTFLHDNNIIHRDISLGNILVNHYSADQLSLRSESRRRWRRANGDNGRVRYCIIDFNISLLLPKDVRRLPCSYAFAGVWMYQPKDVSAGEHDYDPYAFDVACMGSIFASEFDCLVPSIPMLAPLFDMMLTDKVQARFTAREALEFLKQIDHSLTDEQRLASTPRVRSNWNAVGRRWEGLPVEFVKQWSRYRRVKVGWMVRLLRWICSYEHGYCVISWLRRTLKF